MTTMLPVDVLLCVALSDLSSRLLRSLRACSRTLLHACSRPLLQRHRLVLSTYAAFGTLLAGLRSRTLQFDAAHVRSIAVRLSRDHLFEQPALVEEHPQPAGATAPPLRLLTDVAAREVVELVRAVPGLVDVELECPLGSDLLRVIPATIRVLSLSDPTWNYPLTCFDVGVMLLRLPLLEHLRLRVCLEGPGSGKGEDEVDAMLREARAVDDTGLSNLDTLDFTCGLNIGLGEEQLIELICKKAPRLKHVVVTKDGPLWDLYIAQANCCRQLMTLAAGCTSLRSFKVSQSKYPAWFSEDSWFGRLFQNNHELSSLEIELHGDPEQPSDSIQDRTLLDSAPHMHSIRSLKLTHFRPLSSSTLGKLGASLESLKEITLVEVAVKLEAVNDLVRSVAAVGGCVRAVSLTNLSESQNDAQLVSDLRGMVSNGQILHPKIGLVKWGEIPGNEASAPIIS
ncbi:hypothetical protein DFJ73DRAFT_822554 [Zopfochytrium polystomum]|nr:hypothetical protein DFJ73DRAFT_822554 [Zopfochytrium polystomum]